MSEEYIYLDNNATTKIDPRVLDFMMPYFTEAYGNSSSAHLMGRKLALEVDRARELLGNLINSNPENILFTAGATESVNLALKGILHLKKSPKANIVTFTTEHSAVLDTCHSLENSGFEIRCVEVLQNGLIDFEKLVQVIDKDTLIVCAMLANNETGVIQPLSAISEIAHNHGALFMSDATQAVGKIQVDVIEMGIDLLAFSAHKFYGPKGIGALYINPLLKLNPLIFGGGQEKGLRSGTLNVPGIVGFGEAARIAEIEMDLDQKRIETLSQRLYAGLSENHKISLNGDGSPRLYNTLNICFSGIDNEALLMKLGNICVSNGSACHSMTIEPSHVLLAMGLSREDVGSSLRFSLGRFNSEKDIDTTIQAIRGVIYDLGVPML
jgi:cysteine desulfurase